MPQVIVTEAAAMGLERCRRFLAAQSPQAAQRAGRAIQRKLLLLETSPDIGHLLEEPPGLHELVIAFGEAGYVALNRHEPVDDSVYALAFRQQKEAEC